MVTEALIFVTDALTPFLVAIEFSYQVRSNLVINTKIKIKVAIKETSLKAKKGQYISLITFCSSMDTFKDPNGCRLGHLPTSFRFVTITPESILSPENQYISWNPGAGCYESLDVSF